MIQEDNIELLGKQTICLRNDNGVTGYTVFTATSVYENYCVDFQMDTNFNFDCEKNTIGIACTTGGLPTSYITSMSNYIKSHTSIVKCTNDEYGFTYAVRVIFPYLQPTTASSVITFEVHFKIYTNEGVLYLETGDYPQIYNIKPCNN